MRAAVLYEACTPMRAEAISVHVPSDGEVLVRIAATDACRTGYHVIDASWHGPSGRHQLSAVKKRRHRRTGWRECRSVKPGGMAILSLSLVAGAVGCAPC